MVSTRSYHLLDIAVAPISSERVCYILLPEGLKEDGLKWMEKAAESFGHSIVCLSGMDWNTQLTPWSADPVFKKAKPFGGNADVFLKQMTEDYFPSIESQLGLTKAVRTLAGVSLSGLFAIWSATKCDLFNEIISISGSLWYDNFTAMLRESKISDNISRIYISLGDKEKQTKDIRMATIEDATRETVDILNGKGVDTRFVLEENTTHFSSLTPRLDKALSMMKEARQA